MVEKKLVVFTTLLTFILLIAGGLVHSTNSGLACPDWPLCYGQFFPKMAGGILFEHSHRLIAGAVALCTFFFTLLIWKKRKEKELRFLSLGLFLLVLFQATLGGLTVIYKLPTLISTAHLATSMIFFSALLILCFKLYLNTQTPIQTQANQRFSSLTRWLGFSFFAVYIQILLGGIVRHTGSGGVCPDIPFCENVLWPFGAQPAIQLHMAHRWGAVFVSLLTFWVSYVVIRTSFSLKNNPGLRKWLQWHAILAPLLIIVQIVLGFLSVTTLLAVSPVTAHLAFAALLLANTLCLFILTREINKKAHSQDALDQDLKPGIFSDLFSLAKGRLNALVLGVTAITYFLAPASKSLPASRFLFTLIGTFLLVTGAAFLNAYFEKNSDALMERTANRPLPQGRIGENTVLILGIILGLIGVPLLTFQVNAVTGFLGTLAFILYSFIYTPLKAKTPFAALIGAIPGALPPLLGWTAATGKVDLIGTTLFFILFFWQLPHFFAISIYRKKEYERAGTQVLPLANGEKLTRKLMIRYCAMLVPISLFLVPLGIGGALYFYVALVLGIIFFIWTCYGQKPLSGIIWARSLFIYSLIYLPLLFITLLLDTRL